MFGQGTKIIILSSTLKKGIGPRKGSLGYASACKDQAAFSQYGIMATLNEVLFFRYGFEAQERVERKIIISVFPIIKPNHINTRSQVHSLAKRIRFPKNSQVFHTIRDRFSGNHKVPIVLATPLNYYKTDISKVGAKEFCAWIESILMGTWLFSFLNKAAENQNIGNSKLSALNTGNLEMFRMMITNKGFKHDSMKKFSRNVNNRKDAIDALIPLITLAGRWSTKIIVDDYKNYFKNNLTKSSSKFPSELLLTPLAAFIYVPAIFTILKNKIVAIDNKPALQIINDVEHAKTEIAEFSSQFWKNNLLNGKSMSKV